MSKKRVWNVLLVNTVLQIATNRRMTVKYNPPSSCDLEISVKGIKLSVQEDYYASDRVRRTETLSPADWAKLCCSLLMFCPLVANKATALKTLWHHNQLDQTKLTELTITNKNRKNKTICFCPFKKFISFVF